MDGVLAIMVRGLEDELGARMSGELGGILGVSSSSSSTNSDDLVYLLAQATSYDISEDIPESETVADQTLSNRKRRWLLWRK